MHRMRAIASPLLLALVLALQGCGGGGDSAAPDAPTVTLTAAPSAVVTGAASILTWSSANASTCTASGDWAGARATSGTTSTAALAATSTFTLTCASADGSMTGAASAAVTVSSVPPAPTLTLGASPATVASGASATLTWNSSNATACTASGAWSGARATSGTQGTGALLATSSYTLTCTGAGGTVSRTATVAVTTPPANTYSTTFSLTENPISEGGRWQRAGNNFTNVRTANGRAYGTNGARDMYDDSYALLSGFGPDQTAEAVVYRSSSLVTGITHEVELLLRFADNSSGARGYECLFSYGGGVQIVRWNGELGDFTVLDPTGPQGLGRELVTGDVVKAKIVGSLITVYINGTELARVTETTFADGQPGISFFTRPGGNSANFALDSYTVSSN
jgi:hypothetical protein